MATCRIRWIDANGDPTPDNNEAIGRVRTRARHESFAGRDYPYWHEASPWFPICAEHAKRMIEPGMHIWEWEPRNGGPIPPGCEWIGAANSGFATKEKA